MHQHKLVGGFTRAHAGKGAMPPPGDLADDTFDWCSFYALFWNVRRAPTPRCYPSLFRSTKIPPRQLPSRNVGARRSGSVTLPPV